MLAKLIKENKIPAEVTRLLNHNFLKQQNVNYNSNYENVYQFNQYSSNQDIKGIDSEGYQTLQGNLNANRNGTQKYSPRRVINSIAQPNKVWPTGRPRGSLERFSGNMRRRFYYVEPQSLYVGVQGISLQRHHRLSGTADVNRSAEKYYEPKNVIEVDKSINEKQLLNAIEKVSRIFGTPFQINSDREEFYKYILNDKSLQDKFSNIGSKSKSIHSSVQPSREETQQNMFISNNLHNLSVKESYVNNYSSMNQETMLPNKKYFSNYSLSSESEKEKIINLFHKIFRDYNFSSREDKDLILRHIRKLYPSVLFLNGKKIDSLLKSFVTSSYNNRGRDLVNMTKLKAFVKTEKEKLKIKHKHEKDDHREYEDRPIFTKLMADNSNKIDLNLNKRQGNVIQLKTFNMPYRSKNNKKIRENTLAILGTQRRGKSVSKGGN